MPPIPSTVSSPLNKRAFLKAKLNLGGVFSDGKGKGGQDQMLFTVGETVRSGSDCQTIWEKGGWCFFENSPLEIEMEDEYATRKTAGEIVFSRVVGFWDFGGNNSRA